MNWLKIRINGNGKLIVGVLAVGIAWGTLTTQLRDNRSSLIGIQSRVDVCATQSSVAAVVTSVEKFSEAITHRVERLEGFHFQPTP